MPFVNLKDMYQVRSYLSLYSSEIMVDVFITSYLDYYKCLLWGLPKNQIKKLQAIQNTAAHLVTTSYKYDHITFILKDLHWQPVQQRINFKMLLFTFKCLHGQPPKYRHDFLTWSYPKRLRSDNKLLLVLPKSKQVTYGDHAFSIATPWMWNVLPNYIKRSVNIEVIKCHLKTHPSKRVLHLVFILMYLMPTCSHNFITVFNVFFKPL